MLKNDKHYFIRLCILLFVLSSSVPILPVCYANTYGLFGERNASTVISVGKEEVSEISSKITAWRKQKGENIINIYLAIFAEIVCIQFLACICNFLKEYTMVARKVRMNN